MISLDKIYDASHVLSSVIRRTDLIAAPQLAPNCNLYLKPENLQITGSFKVRGAYYMISQLGEEEKKRGVIACSAGNHAQGVALAASHMGISSLICLPEGAPLSKVEATKRLGADICLVPGVYDDAYNRALELKEEKGYTFVHPFDNEDVICGQGTIGLELIEQLPDVDVVLVPIGGGGLASGVAYAMKQLKPNVQIYGVQAAGAPSMLNSLQHNQIECLPRVSTIADGIAVKEPGEHTFALCKEYLEGVVTVSDDEIASAILSLIEKHKLIAEGAGAVAVAAAMFQKVPLDGKNVIALVSGGNIDVNILSRVITRGLRKSGRNCVFTFELADKPGQLLGIVQIIAQAGGNIISVYHERSGSGSDLNECFMRIVLETRNEEHIQAIRQALAQHGYHIVDDPRER